MPPEKYAVSFIVKSDHLEEENENAVKQEVRSGWRRRSKDVELLDGESNSNAVR